MIRFPGDSRTIIHPDINPGSTLFDLSGRTSIFDVAVYVIINIKILDTGAFKKTIIQL